MRYCVSNDSVEYDENNEFAVYVAEQKGKRFYILQYVRNDREPEHYERYGYKDSADTGAGERNFIYDRSILDRDDVIAILGEKENVRYQISFVPKDKLGRILLALDVSHSLHASSFRQAFQFMTDKLKPLLGGVDINPVELALVLADGGAHMKIDGRSLCNIL